MSVRRKDTDDREGERGEAPCFLSLLIAVLQLPACKNNYVWSDGYIMTSYGFNVSLLPNEWQANYAYVFHLFYYFRFLLLFLQLPVFSVSFLLLVLSPLSPFPHPASASTPPTSTCPLPDSGRHATLPTTSLYQLTRLLLWRLTPLAGSLMGLSTGFVSFSFLFGCSFFLCCFVGILPNQSRLFLLCHFSKVFSGSFFFFIPFSFFLAT